jgi:hypothetical protein
MTPIRELLDRIRWDDAFGNARFDVDYYDRVEDTLVRAGCGAWRSATGSTSSWSSSRRTCRSIACRCTECVRCGAKGYESGSAPRPTRLADNGGVGGAWR